MSVRLAPVVKTRHTLPAMRKPKARCGWLALNINPAGAPLAGSPVTTDPANTWQAANGLAINGQHHGISFAQPAVLTVLANGASYHADGGLTQAGSAYYTVLPTGAELAALQDHFDLGSMVAGESLLVGVSAVMPAGWAAAHSAQNTVVCLGNLTSGSASGGIDFGINSSERPQIVTWPIGGTAGVTTTPTTTALLADGKNAWCYELSCTAANTFRMRVHLRNPSNGVAESSAWTSAADLSTGGTGCPSVGTAGMRISRRNGSATLQAQNSERYLSVWWARLSDTTLGVAARAVEEAWQQPFSLPEIIRISDVDPLIYGGPTGNADKSWGEIALSDMFVYLDPATAFEDHPPGTNIEVGISALKLDNLAAAGTISAPSPSGCYYVDDSDFKGIVRPDGSPKWGLHKTGTFAGKIRASANRNDPGPLGVPDPNSYRGRAEAKTTIALPTGVPIWFAAERYLDFTPGVDATLGNLVFAQLFAGYASAGSGLVANFLLAMRTSDPLRVSVDQKYSLVSPTTSANVLTYPDVPYALAPYSGSYEALQSFCKRWIKIVGYALLSADEADDPFLQLWIDGVLLYERLGPNIYAGPSSDGKSTDPFWQRGIYTPSIQSPDTNRDVICGRDFVCRDTGSYSEAQVRAALTAAEN